MRDIFETKDQKWEKIANNFMKELDSAWLGYC